MLGVGLWGGAKGNSHTGKGHRAGASVYFGHMSSFSVGSNYISLMNAKTCIFTRGYRHS